MNITKLVIENFLTIGKATLDLDDRGLLLIQGVNNDDPSAESNGSGKSSIVDALCWAIYGVTARDVTGDAVVNKTAKKGCKVTVELSDGSTTYRILRFRKDTTNKNQVFVIQQDPGVHGGVSLRLHKGTEKETQEVINQIMGCSLDVFMAAVYSGQERMADLPGMTDKMLKMLIEEAAGVEVLTEAYSVARDRFGKVKSSLDVLNGQNTIALIGLARLHGELRSQEEKSREFEDTRRDRAKAELMGVIPMNLALTKLTDSLSDWDVPALVRGIDECKSKIAAQKTEQAELDRLVGIAAFADRDVARLKASYQYSKTSVESKERGLVMIADRVGLPCGECGKPYVEDDIAEARKAQELSIVKAKEELRPAAVALKVALEASTVASDAVAKFKATLTDISTVAAAQHDLSANKGIAEGLVRDIAAKRLEITHAKAAANVKLTEANPWAKALESKKGEIESNERVAKTLAESVEMVSAEVEILADAVKVFGPAGVRAHILDTVTPYLNDRTQEYLGALSDGNIHAVWATLTTTAKGDLKEKFNIEVTNDMGAESFAGLSGGEKRKVRLATAMALQDMVASRATKPINIAICDEIDHALDEAGLERLMTILERKGKEKGTVLIISHNSLSDWCSDVITVTKSGGLAVVSGANERGF
jgi:DNA repair exonuclease SbcCD ATPase subunit